MSQEEREWAEALGVEALGNDVSRLTAENEALRSRLDVAKDQNNGILAAARDELAARDEEIKKISAVAHKHGWNGVENSKILWTFLDETIAARDQRIAELERKMAEMREGRDREVATGLQFFHRAERVEAEVQRLRAALEPLKMPLMLAAALGDNEPRIKLSRAVVDGLRAVLYGDDAVVHNTDTETKRLRTALEQQPCTCVYSRMIEYGEHLVSQCARCAALAEPQESKE